MEWVSNIVPVNKKHVTIRVCIDFRDLNKACPKDNFPTLHIDQIIDNCAGSVIFSFMDGFFGYNQIEILPPISIRRHSFSHGEPLRIRSYLSAWKTLAPCSSMRFPMHFMTLNILLNCTLMTSLLIHSDRRTTPVILETYSWDVVIIIYSSICINLFSVLRRDVC